MKKNYSQQDCLRAIPEGSNKKRFEYCVNSKNQVTYVSAIQGHTGGNMISPEFLGHIEIPHTWKKFVFYDLNYIMDKGLIAGGREKRGGRQTIFFTPLNPFGENSVEEAPGESLTVPRKVQDRNSWKNMRIQ